VSFPIIGLLIPSRKIESRSTAYIIFCLREVVTAEGNFALEWEPAYLDVDDAGFILGSSKNNLKPKF